MTASSSVEGGAARLVSTPAPPPLAQSRPDSVVSSFSMSTSLSPSLHFQRDGRLYGVHGYAQGTTVPKDDDDHDDDHHHNANGNADNDDLSSAAFLECDEWGPRKTQCRSCLRATLRLDSSAGDWVCTSCGLVNESHVRFCGPEWRDFDNDDDRARDRPSRARSGCAASASASASAATDERRHPASGGLEPTRLSRHPFGGGAWGSGSGHARAREALVRRRLIKTNGKLDRMMVRMHEEKVREARDAARRVMSERRRRRATVTATATATAVAAAATKHDAYDDDDDNNDMIKIEGGDPSEAGLAYERLAAKREQEENHRAAALRSDKWSLDRAILLHGPRWEQRPASDPNVTRDIESEREDLLRTIDASQKEAAEDLYRAVRILRGAVRRLGGEVHGKEGNGVVGGKHDDVNGGRGSGSGSGSGSRSRSRVSNYPLPESVANEAIDTMCRYVALRDGFKVVGVSKHAPSSHSSSADARGKEHKKEADEERERRRRLNRDRKMGALGSAALYLSARGRGHGRTLREVCAAFVLSDGDVVDGDDGRRALAKPNGGVHGGRDGNGDDDDAIIKPKHCSRAMGEIKSAFPEYVRSVSQSSYAVSPDSGAKGAGVSSYSYSSSVAPPPPACLNRAAMVLSLPPAAVETIRVLFFECRGAIDPTETTTTTTKAAMKEGTAKENAAERQKQQMLRRRHCVGLAGSFGSARLTADAILTSAKATTITTTTTLTAREEAALCAAATRLVCAAGEAMQRLARQGRVAVANAAAAGGGADGRYYGDGVRGSSGAAVALLPQLSSTSSSPVAKGGKKRARMHVGATEEGRAKRPKTEEEEEEEKGEEEEEVKAAVAVKSDKMEVEGNEERVGQVAEDAPRPSPTPSLSEAKDPDDAAATKGQSEGDGDGGLGAKEMASASASALASDANAASASASASDAAAENSGSGRRVVDTAWGKQDFGEGKTEEEDKKKEKENGEKSTKRGIEVVVVPSADPLVLPILGSAAATTAAAIPDAVASSSSFPAGALASAVAMTVPLKTEDQSIEDVAPYHLGHPRKRRMRVVGGGSGRSGRRNGGGSEGHSRDNAGGGGGRGDRGNPTPFDALSHAPLEDGRTCDSSRWVWDEWSAQPPWGRDVGSISDAFMVPTQTVSESYRAVVGGTARRRAELLRLLQGRAESAAIGGGRGGANAGVADSGAPTASLALLWSRIAAAAPLMS